MVNTSDLTALDLNARDVNTSVANAPSGNALGVSARLVNATDVQFDQPSQIRRLPNDAIRGTDQGYPAAKGTSEPRHLLAKYLVIHHLV